MKMTIATGKKRELIDITEEIARHMEGSGVVHIFVQHTTAALTTADLDPGTDLDLLDALAGMTPQKQWRHPHDPGHFPDHLWATLLGPSLTVPVVDGRLQLGTWQRIVLIELDGPRERTVQITLLQT